MANIHTNLPSLFSNIASAIREKTGNNGTIVADNFPDAIRAIPTGSSVTVGQVTQSSESPTITIPDFIGKDNIALMYMHTGSTPASAMSDIPVINVIKHGTSFFYNTLYSDETYADGNDNFIKFDKTTGGISINSNMRYNETFVVGNYMYVTW